MTELAADPGAETLEGSRTPWHLWIVGIISLIWNAGGAYDYSMTHLKGAEYLKQMQMGEDAVAWFAAAPAWATAGWALGVWGAMAGSILLLLRSRHAVTALAVSLLGVILMTAYTLNHAMPGSVSSPGAQAFDWAIKIVAVLLLVYAWTMRQRGVLR